MVFVGGSSVYRFWNPLQAYSEQGFTSYDYTSSNFPAPIAIGAMEELKKTQDPKLIIFDIRMFHTRLWDNTYPGGFRLYVDSMEPSLQRMRMIDYYGEINGISWVDRLPFYWDIAYYHTNRALSSPLNWTLIDHEISEQAMRAAGYFAHGFLPGTEHYFFDIPQDRTDASAELRKNIAQCYIDLLEYINASDVPVLLVESPFVPLENDVEEMDTLLQLAEEYNVPVLDTNQYITEMGLDYRTDFYDTNHVNILGAEKYTSFLAEYLAEHYDLPDHRNDGAYADWDSAYADYAEQAVQLEELTWGGIHSKEETIAKEDLIRETDDPLEWLAMTDDPNLVLLFDKRKTDGPVSYTSLAALKHLGLSTDVLSSEENHIGVYSESLLYAGAFEEEYNGMIDMIWDTMDDIPYSITENSICVQDQHFLTERRGITFVIVDKNTREVVDYAMLDVDTDGQLVLTHLHF